MCLVYLGTQNVQLLAHKYCIFFVIHVQTEELMCVVQSKAARLSAVVRLPKPVSQFPDEN